MKLLVDAQLPRQLVREFSAAGHEAVHTLDLPLGNRTPDEDIIAIAIREERIVVTKDSDFVTAFWLHGVPPKLLLISTGNIANDSLARLLTGNLPAIDRAFAQYRFVELSPSVITVHA